jgi:hypothetical protein
MDTRQHLIDGYGLREIGLSYPGQAMQERATSELAAAAVQVESFCRAIQRSRDDAG